ncbi:hypothetical protein [Streptomyces sp. NPDC048157]|uniref:hypothetical protein n=1 Tax=Streptomyces sp. NPDC048157 TaxID=3365503 RepID=UPI00371CD7AC
MQPNRSWRTGAWWLDRGIVLVAAFIAGGAALYSSFDALSRLADWAGWSDEAAPGLPLTVDVIALAAGIRYVRLHPDAAGRALAFKGVTWSAVVSVVGNAIVHAGLMPGWSVPHRVIAVGVSAIPALGIAYVVHLVAAPVVRQLDDDEVVEPTGAEMSGPDPDPEEWAVPEEEIEEEVQQAVPLFPSPPRQRRAHARKGSLKAEGLELISAAVDSGKPVPPASELCKALGCSLRYAQMIHVEWTEKTA